jgi:hypothetical protein
MQIIFEKTILEQIEDAKASAKVAGKVIKEIRLSKVETEQLKRELQVQSHHPRQYRVTISSSMDILGVKVIPYQPEVDSDF